MIEADAVFVVISPESAEDEVFEKISELIVRSNVPIEVFPILVTNREGDQDFSLAPSPYSGYYLPSQQSGSHRYQVALPSLAIKSNVLFDLRANPYDIVNVISDFYVDLGQALDNNSDEEIDYYDQAIIFNPAHGRAYHLRGTVYGECGDPQRAIADLSKAIEINALSPQTYANRARQYRLTKQYDLALADCAATLRLDAKHRMAYIIRGNIEINLEQYAEAVRDFDAALAIDPQDAMSYANRGHAKCLLGQMDAALADCNRALMLDPQWWMAHLFRGEIYQTQLEQKKRIEKTDPLLDLALADFNAVLGIGHDDTAYYGRARIRYWKGDRQGAVADCQATLALNPQHPAVDRMRAFIEHEGKPHS